MLKLNTKCDAEMQLRCVVSWLATEVQIATTKSVWVNKIQSKAICILHEDF